MTKTTLPAQNILFPLPVVLVSCADANHRPNIITLAWAGTLNSVPPIIGISVQPIRHSHEIIDNSGEFVVNIPSTAQLHESTICGTKSGRDMDKFKELSLTADKATTLTHAPLIREATINIECVVTKRVVLGSHTLFLGEVKLVHVADRVLDDKGKVDHRLVDPLVFCGSRYFSLGEMYSR